MATGSEYKLTLTRSRVLQSVYETLCQNLDLQRVGAELTSGEILKKSVAKKVKFAMKNKDIKIFYAVLENRFDFKSFVYFLEILDSFNDEKHRRILNIMVPGLACMEPEEGSDPETLSKMKSIVGKYQQKQESTQTPTSTTAVSETAADETAMSSTVESSDCQAVRIKSKPLELKVLYYNHPIETKVFNKTNQFLSYKTFRMSEDSAPGDIIPSESKATQPYCPVVSKINTTDQNILHSNIHDVTVVVESEAFPEHLNEFSISLVVNDYSQDITMPEDCTGIYSALITLRCDPKIERFQDFVTVTIPHCAVGDTESLCVLSAPDSESQLKVDQDIVIEFCDDYYLTFKTMHFTSYRVTRTTSPSIQKRLKSVSIQRLPIRNFRKALSLQMDDVQAAAVPIPRSYSCPAKPESTTDTRFVAVMYRPKCTDGAYWQVLFFVTYQLSAYHEFEKKLVEEYWNATEAARCNLQMPAIRFEVVRRGECSDSTFLIGLHGSKSQPIMFKVPCRSPTFSQQPYPYSIKIISEMYGDQMIAALKGEVDSSSIILTRDDVNCCVLLCEVSFHLFRWKDLGVELAMRIIDLDALDAMNMKYFEKAFRMLDKWLLISPQNLKLLVDGLNSVGYSLDLSDWTTCYNNSRKNMDPKFMIEVADLIQCHWKFVARILGLSETTITDIAEKNINNFHEQAIQMLYKWKNQCALPESEKLFKSVHCIHEHIPASYLKTALSTVLL